MFFDQALLELKPGAEWSIKGETCYENLTWFDKKQSKPTEKEITDKIAELEADYEKQAYARARAKSYDPIPEQLDQIYHDMDGWKARIKSVKDKYPKP